MSKKRPSTPARRGRPKQDRPPTEATLRAAVEAASVGIVRAMLATEGVLLPDGDAHKAAQALSLRFGAPIDRDVDQLRLVAAAHAQVLAGLQAFRAVQPVLGRELTNETNVYLGALGAGMEGVFARSWSEMLVLSSLLSQAADFVLTDDAILPPILPTEHELMIEHMRDPEDMSQLSPLEVRGTPLTLRELAAVSLVLGHWPALKPGKDTVNAVMTRTEKAVERACETLGVVLPVRGRRGGTNGSAPTTTDAPGDRRAATLLTAPLWPQSW